MRNIEGKGRNGSWCIPFFALLPGLKIQLVSLYVIQGCTVVITNCAVFFRLCEADAITGNYLSLELISGLWDAGK